MIKIADLPIVRAQLARDTDPSNGAQAKPDGSDAASGQEQRSTRPDLVLDQGKYYVVARAK